MAYARRPKSTVGDIGPYFTDKKLLAPPLARPAYSDRMAYVLAEMSDLAYRPFEGPSGVIDDAVDQARSLNVTNDADLRAFLDQFSTQLLSGRYLNRNTLKNILGNSGFALLDVIDVDETQGFVCRRAVDGEPPYLVLAFRGTEMNVSDWLTDARCVPRVEGKAKVHTGFIEAFTVRKNGNGRTVKEVVEEILGRPEAMDQDGQRLPLFITGHSLGGALALLATKLVAPNVSGACYTFGAPRVGNYEYFRFIKTPVVPSCQLRRRRTTSATRCTLRNVSGHCACDVLAWSLDSSSCPRIGQGRGVIWQDARLQTLRRSALSDRCRGRAVPGGALTTESACDGSIGLDVEAPGSEPFCAPQEPQHEYLPPEVVAYRQ